ncbi:MAG: M48 family metalloprotease [Prevotella sp.]|nr:M48 family metalloprotease [Prevotella sp.]
MMKDEEIRRLARNEIMRIALFVAYYIALIALGAAILYSTYWVTQLGLAAVTNAHINPLYVFIAWAGYCVLALMFGLYLVKPLFKFTRDRDASRMEVTEEECPQLFAVIRNLAQYAQSPMPKHVYLTADVNASVFYNTSFWSIFLPVRKNLTIGLGLFEDMSVDEVTAILAHEFGHFSQKSMKVGSTVYVTTYILANLIETDDFWDEWLDKWCMSNLSLFTAFGLLTRRLTNVVKRLTYRIYLYVQRGDRRLSRQMELDADKISASYVGSDTFVSSLYKIAVLNKRRQRLDFFVRRLLADGQAIGNYFDAQQQMLEVLPADERIAMSYDQPATVPLLKSYCPSRLSIEYAYDTHPSAEDRIANARNLHFQGIGHDRPRPAWSLIPDALRERVSQRALQLMADDCETDGQPLVTLTPEAFKQWAAETVEREFIPDAMLPYFNRQLATIDLATTEPSPAASPFRPEHERIISELLTAYGDLELMQSIADGETAVERVSYEGRAYDISQLPIEAHTQYQRQLYEQVEQIDNDVYRYLLSHTDDAASVRRYYEAAMYCERLTGLLGQLLAERNELWQLLERPKRYQKKEFAQLCLHVADYEERLRKVLKELNPDLLSINTEEDFIKQLHQFESQPLRVRDDLTAEYLTPLYQWPDTLWSRHDELYSYAHLKLSQLAARLTV